MRMNFKNIFMGLTAWLVLGFALHGSDKDKGQRRMWTQPTKP